MDIVISTKRSAWRDLSTTLEMTKRALEMTQREGKNTRYSSVVCRLDPDHLGGTGFHRAPKRFLGYFAHHDLFRKVKGHFAGFRPVSFFVDLYKHILDSFLLSF